MFLAKPFELKALINKVIEVEKPATKFKGLALICKQDSNIPNIIIGDPFRLYRVLVNLVGNAIKFTEKGYVNITTKLLKLETRRVILDIVVSDTGIGIPKDKQNYIYERFSKVTPSSREIYKGMGIGLRIVKKFIDDMDADIVVDSEPNKGATFTCTVPFKRPLKSGTKEMRQ